MNHLAHIFMCNDLEIISNYLKTKGVTTSEINLEDYKFTVELNSTGVFTAKVDADFMRSVSEITIYADEHEVKVIENLNTDDIKRNSCASDIDKNMALLSKMNKDIKGFIDQLLSMPEFKNGLINRNETVTYEVPSKQKINEFMEDNSFVSTGTIRKKLTEMRKNSEGSSTTYSHSFEVANEDFTKSKVIVYYVDGHIHMTDGTGKFSPFHQQSTLLKVMDRLERTFVAKDSIKKRQINTELMRTYTLAA